MGQQTSFKGSSELYRVGYSHSFELHFIGQRNFLYLQAYTIHPVEKFPTGNGPYHVSLHAKKRYQSDLQVNLKTLLAIIARYGRSVSQ